MDNHKSAVIALINVIQAFGTAMFVFIFPLYFYQIFQSEYLVGQIHTIKSLSTIFITLGMGFLLSYFARYVLYKIVVIAGMAGILLLLVTNDFFEAITANFLFALLQMIAPAILSLYLRDLTSSAKFAHVQGIVSSVMNSAWLIAPMLGGFLLSYISKHEEIFNEYSISIFGFTPDHISYSIVLAIIFLFY
ncbi:MAG: hypothetical protein U9Q15_05485, partial [Patescibacteria group bacterium]|nr:hypothetical protein [Patescibacteria group bacterium]